MEVQELAQLVKGLPHKLEALNSIPRTQVRREGRCTLVSQSREGSDSSVPGLHWPDSLEESVSLRLWRTSVSKGKVDDKKQ